MTVTNRAGSVKHIATQRADRSLQTQQASGPTSAGATARPTGHTKVNDFGSTAPPKLREGEKATDRSPIIDATAALKARGLSSEVIEGRLSQVVAAVDAVHDL